MVLDDQKFLIQMAVNGFYNDVIWFSVNSRFTNIFLYCGNLINLNSFTFFLKKLLYFP